MEEEDEVINVPGGLGPWFVVLAFNTSTSEKCKKHTHLVAHTLPHLAIDNLKRSHSQGLDPKADDFWVIMMKVGPFEDWNVCVSYLNEWNMQTRGRTRRLERGWNLYTRYKSTYHLCMWGQYHDLETMTLMRKEQKSKSLQQRKRKRPLKMQKTQTKKHQSTTLVKLDDAIVFFDTEKDRCDKTVKALRKMIATKKAA